jgi:hypothetical protein
MELLLALLMALGALVYPLFVDVRKHGRDNILQRTVIEVADWPPIAAVLRTLKPIGQNAQHEIERAYSIVVFCVILAVLWMIFHLLAK